MERGLGGMLLPDMQEQAAHLQELTSDVEAAQTALLEGMLDASKAGMALRVIAHNVGVNHERVRRALAGNVVVRPF